MEVIGYVRVSTAEQADSGLGLAAQRTTLTLEAGRRGWQLLGVFEDAGLSGKTVANRPGLDEALALLQAGGAAALVVAKLDRLSRSLLDFAALMQRSRLQGWSLIALDLGVDTTTPSGEMIANVMATFAQFERRLIAQRTKDALAVRRSQGVLLGRPRAVPSEVLAEITRWREEGASWRAVARHLDACGVPTGHGAPAWSASSARYVFMSREIGARSGASN